MKFPLDIDKAQSVFQLLFLCCTDSTCSDPVDVQFEEALREITQGVQVPKAALDRLRVIHEEVVRDPPAAASAAARAVGDVGTDREMLCAVLRIVLRISSDDGMLSSNDRSRVKDIAQQFGLCREELELLEDFERELLRSSLLSGEPSGSNNDLESHFQTLGCTAEMSEAQIRRRYRKLVMRFHPDRSLVRGDEQDLRARFEQVQQAYLAIRRSFSGA